MRESLGIELNQEAFAELLEGSDLVLNVDGLEITLRASDALVENYRENLQLALLRAIPVGLLPN